MGGLDFRLWSLGCTGGAFEGDEAECRNVFLLGIGGALLVKPEGGKG